MRASEVKGEGLFASWRHSVDRARHNMQPLSCLNIKHHRTQILRLLPCLCSRVCLAACFSAGSLSMHAAHVALLSSNRVGFKGLLHVLGHQELAGGFYHWLVAVVVIEDDEAVGGAQPLKAAAQLQAPG